MMDAVRVPSNKWIGPAMGGLIVYYAQTAAGHTTATALMITLATVLHLTAMALRDAEFRVITTHAPLNRKDVFGYTCSLIYDAVVLFGLITGAGLLLPFERFAPLALIVCAVIPFVALYVIRNDYAPDRAAQGLKMRHWAAPVYLCVGILVLWGAKGVQVASGSQPYAWLVLGSVIMMNTQNDIRFAGAAKAARFAALCGVMILLLWNYMQIS